MTDAGELDLVIVGAGAAGFAAAQTVLDLGPSALPAGAMDRIGGHAHIDTASFGVPWDRGRRWLHAADVNPFIPLADAYGFRGALAGDAVREAGATACTTWGREPTIRGAYTTARPGQGHRRADLAVPLDDRLFFAGEATSSDVYSTCYGAHLSGIAAARAAAAVRDRA